MKQEVLMASIVTSAFLALTSAAQVFASESVAVPDQQTQIQAAPIRGAALLKELCSRKMAQDAETTPETAGGPRGELLRAIKAECAQVNQLPAAPEAERTSIKSQDLSNTTKEKVVF
ncbi:hypothetical protein ACI2KR_31985 [Pseudomonas luteola]